jgi:hypothetical protein
MSSAWTAAEVEKAKSLNAQGYDMETAAARLGRTEGGVRKKLAQLGLRPQNTYGKWTPEMDATLRRMAAEGCSAGQAAYVLGITRNAAIGRSHRTGVHFRSNKNGRPAVQGPNLPKHRPIPAAFRVEAPIPEPIRLVRAEPVPFLDRRPHQCAWPLWGNNDPLDAKRCCGAQVIPGISYCHDHFKLSCGPGASPERRINKLEAA